MMMEMISMKSLNSWFVGWKVQIALLVFFLSLPLLVSTALATEIAIYSLFAMAFNLLLGFTGILSFGHAIYFGLGAYVAGISLRFFNSSVWLALLLSMATGLVVAGIIGLLSIKKKGVYFAMISMALAQMCYFIALSPMAWLTGGEDGFQGIPKLALQFPVNLDLNSGLPLYIFVSGIVFLSILAMTRIIGSPFGWLLKAVRENEARIKACGFNTNYLKFMCLILSGIFSGLAGGLYTLYLGFVPISTLFWLTSGTVLMMALLGGIHSFAGPVIGVTCFLFMQNTISLYTERWQFWVGGLFMVIVFLFPDGILGTIEKKFLYFPHGRQEENR